MVSERNVPTLCGGFSLSSNSYTGLLDVSWQTALANSAVAAAEDVRSAVRAGRTASNARTAATTAGISAQKACDTGKFKSIDEARAAQTRASIAQSHAIHAAVVEHEAKTVKRRATLALAHDVKCWNAHRKREILQTALSYAKSQHEATRRAVDAWSCLRDGYVGSTIIPSAQTRRIPKPMVDLVGSDDAKATIYANIDEDEVIQSIVAVDHELLKQRSDSLYSTTDEGFNMNGPDTILPLVVASPIPEEEDDEDDDFGQSQAGVLFPFGLDSSHLSANPAAQHVPVESNLFSSLGCKSPVQSKPVFDSHMFGHSSPKSYSEGEENEVLTSSMQSLVNGLMNWGGQYNDEEDFALPNGMAASIALEESGVLGTLPKIA